MYGEATEAKEHGSNVYIKDMYLVEIDDVEVDEYILSLRDLQKIWG